MPLTGYLHPGYAQSLAEFGTPVELPRSGAWLLKRPIPACGDFDGTSCYPYLACRDWPALASDLEALGDDLVSFAAAPDPFGNYTMADLERAFPDVVMHFKDHYVADLRRPIREIVSKHHLHLAEKALCTINVECSAEPLPFLDEMMELFALTIERFHITGMRAPSKASIARQLALPGCYVSLARYQGRLAGAHTQFVHGETAYAHATGSTDEANALGVAYALYYAEIEYFADKVRWLDWGGDPGIATGGGGVGRFKRGWSTDTRPAYFCGRVFDRERYDEITRARGLVAGGYFPAYRKGEFQ